MPPFLEVEAFRQYYAACADITQVLWYGLAIRFMVRLLSKGLSLDPILQHARHDPDLQRALYLCVSAQDSYRNIVRNSLRLPLLTGCIARVATPPHPRAWAAFPSSLKA
jgi:hypothetical protein